MNKFGLPRNIPESTKREIRHRSKFGCVVCRCAIYQYEHIDPEFSEAKKHDPAKMCLLCGHCHDKVTKGLLSKSTIKQKYAEVQTNSDIAKPFDQFDLAHNSITVVLGSCIFNNAKTLIVLNGEVILAIEPPEDNSSFPMLSGHFSDCEGNELMRIEKNEWIGPSVAWDMEITGREIVIRSNPKTIALHLRVNPPHTIEVVQLNMRIGNSHLVLKAEQLLVGRVSPEAEFYIGIERLECVGAEIGVCVDQIDNTFTPDEIKIIGGEIIGPGIKFAVGSGSTTVRGISIEDATKERTIITFAPLTTGLQGGCK